MDTGRFVSQQEATGVLAEAKAYGSLGAPDAYRHDKAIRIAADAYGFSREEMRTEYRKWLTKFYEEGTTFKEYFGESP